MGPDARDDLTVFVAADGTVEAFGDVGAAAGAAIRRHRFRLLDTIRQYAARRLDDAGERATVCDRHLEHLLSVAEEAEPLLDHDKDTWRTRIEPERDNVRTALEWGLSADDPERGRRLGAATAWLWNLHGSGPEGLALLRRAIEREPTARSLLQARLMLGYALVGDTAAPYDVDPVHEGRELAAELGDHRLYGRFLTLTALGTLYKDGGLDTAWRLCDDALRSAHTAADEHGRDMALALQGLILHLRDQHDAARTLLTPVTERLIQHGDRGIASTLLVFQSTTALCTADIAAAHRLAEQAATIAAPLADYHRVGTAQSQLALLRGVGGDIDGGLALLHGFLRIAEGAGTDVFVPGMARTLGLLHLWRGDVDTSVRWLAPNALPLDQTEDDPPDPLAMPPLAEALRHQGRPADAAAVLDRAEAIARRNGMPRVLAEVLDQRGRLTGPEDVADALDLHHEALQLRVDYGLRTSQIASLEALGTLMARTRRVGTGTRILATAALTRASIDVPLHPIDAAGHETTLAQLRAALGDDDYDAAWRDGSRMTLDDAVVLVRRTRGRRARPTTGWASLTPTEMQVVSLIVDGLSNPEIATKLLMRRSTVKTHFSHIFTKLGISNRIELAAMAAQRLHEESHAAASDASPRRGPTWPRPRGP